jgi:hypothetical protein
MMQSYAGCIRVFPNTQNLGPARFENLRAVGAFLISATYDGKKVTHFSLHSEKGKTVNLASPWGGSGLRVTRVSDHEPVQVALKVGLASFDTRANETYLITSA